MGDRWSLVLTMTSGVALSLAALAVPLAMTRPCLLPVPFGWPENPLFWLFSLLGLIAATLRWIRWSTGWRRVGASAIAGGAWLSLVLLTDVGIVALGHGAWWRLARLTEDPVRRACYIGAIVDSTEYGGDVFRTHLRRAPSEEWRDLIEAAAEGTHLDWRERQYREWLGQSSE